MKDSVYYVFRHDDDLPPLPKSEFAVSEYGSEKAAWDAAMQAIRDWIAENHLPIAWNGYQWLYDPRKSGEVPVYVDCSLFHPHAPHLPRLFGDVYSAAFHVKDVAAFLNANEVGDSDEVLAYMQYIADALDALKKAMEIAPVVTKQLDMPFWWLNSAS